MKIFVSGVIEKDKMCDALIERINSIIKVGDEIIIGNFSESDEQIAKCLSGIRYEKVSVCVNENQTVKYCLSTWKIIKNTFTGFRDLWMRESIMEHVLICDEAEYGFIVWDEQFYGVFADIVGLLVREKSVEVYLTKRDTSIVLNTLEDLKKILGEQLEYPFIQFSTMTFQDYMDILDEFVPSKSMKNYLANKQIANQYIGKRDVIQLIMKAPVSIFIKRDYMYKLTSKEDLFFDILDAISTKKKESMYEIIRLMQLIFFDSFYAYARRLDYAIESLKSTDGGIFYLTEEWYDEEMEEQKAERGTPYIKSEKAIEYIQADIKECKIDEESLYWYRIEKWVPNEEDMIWQIEYYLIQDKICYFNIYEENYYKYHNWFFFDRHKSHEPCTYNLNLPVPFNVGDIVTIDCAPFAPKKRVILIENWDHVDWCSLQTIYKDEEGYWNTANVKDVDFVHCYLYAIISPFYRMEKYSGELLENEMILLEVQKYLAGDKEKGRTLWKKIDDERDVTTERLREILRDK